MCALKNFLHNIQRLHIELIGDICLDNTFQKLFYTVLVSRFLHRDGTNVFGLGTQSCPVILIKRFTWTALLMKQFGLRNYTGRIACRPLITRQNVVEIRINYFRIIRDFRGRSPRGTLTIHSFVVQIYMAIFAVYHWNAGKTMDKCKA